MKITRDFWKNQRDSRILLRCSLNKPCNLEWPLKGPLDKFANFQKSRSLTITLTPCLRSGNICVRPFLSLLHSGQRAAQALPILSHRCLPASGSGGVFWHHPTHPPIPPHSFVLNPWCARMPEPASQNVTPITSRPPPPQKPSK